MIKFSWKSKIYTLLSCLFFIIVWDIIAKKINNNIFLPNIKEICSAIYEISCRDKFLFNIVVSFERSIISFLVALILSVILGMLSYMHPFFEYFIKPLNSFVKTIPTMVLVVLALVWCNKDYAPYIVGIGITFPILYEGIRDNLKNADKKILEMAKIYEISTFDKIIRIYIPLIKIYLMSVFVSTLSLTFKVVIAGEVHGQPKYGIGSQIQIEKINFNTPAIFAWIVLIVIISLFMELLKYILIKRMYRCNDGNSN
ncbi:ABC transporter permease subunit [Clostridium sp. BJN0001]|uniref:ABC transporter permease n=1 Tax=Clostridium sp. BJN0001 TaxID=2930219 RepID=UPI001FD05CDF|nr:ABC transporter permease subunit [Clostridium sp. BJN0001]